MKRQLLFISTLIIALTMSVSSAFAQYDAQAKTVLDQMSQTYQKMSAYEAQFVYQLKNQKGDKVEEEMKGQITVKGNMFRMKTDDQEVFNNNQTVWTYIKQDNEVTVTDNEEGAEMNPTRIYNMYKKGFKYLLTEEVRKGKTVYQVVDLIPEDKDLDYFKIRLFINKANNRLGSWTIFQKNGMLFTFQILDFKSDVKVSDGHFVFEKGKYPNVEVVNLTEQ